MSSNIMHIFVMIFVKFDLDLIQLDTMWPANVCERIKDLWIKFHFIISANEMCHQSHLSVSFFQITNRFCNYAISNFHSSFLELSPELSKSLHWWMLDFQWNVKLIHISTRINSLIIYSCITISQFMLKSWFLLHPTKICAMQNIPNLWYGNIKFCCQSNDRELCVYVIHVCE